MKRHLLTLVLSGLVGRWFWLAMPRLATRRSAPVRRPRRVLVAAPAPCPAPAPAPVCEPTVHPRKHCGLLAGLKGIKLGCHKKASVCAEPSRLLVRRSPTRPRSAIRPRSLFGTCRLLLPPGFGSALSLAPLDSPSFNKCMLRPCVVVIACIQRMTVGRERHDSRVRPRYLGPSAAGFENSCSTSV